MTPMRLSICASASLQESNDVFVPKADCSSGLTKVGVHDYIERLVWGNGIDRARDKGPTWRADESSCAPRDVFMFAQLIESLRVARMEGYSVDCSR